MPLHVPRLAKKLQCLYQRHESVNTHESLAEYHLHIAPNNISIWINGNEVRARDLVPSRHVKRLTDLFEIDVAYLELESLEAFKSSLGSRLGQHSPWQELLTRAIASDAIHLMRREENREPVLPSRGLIADDDEPLEQFQLGERLYISLALTGQWIDEARRGDAYAVLLSADRAKTTCLCPSSLAPYPHLSSPSLLVPHSAPEKTLKVAGPVGSQSVLVLITGAPLTDNLYAGLMQACGTDVLNRLAAHIIQTKDTPWQLLRKDYEVL